MKQIEEMKKYVKKNWKEMAEKAAVGALAGGTVYVLYKLTGTKSVKTKSLADYYNDLEVPEAVQHIIRGACASKRFHETIVESQVIELNELGELGKKIVETYDHVDASAPIVATISIAR